MKRTSLSRTTPLMTRTPLARSATPLVRRTRLAPVTRDTAKRQRRFERAFLSSAYVAWIHAQPCAVPGCTRSDIECAHVGRPRSRGGCWYEIAPLCSLHHREQEKRTAWSDAKYGTDLEGRAAGLAQEWMAFTREEC